MKRTSARKMVVEDSVMEGLPRDPRSEREDSFIGEVDEADHRLQEAERRAREAEAECATLSARLAAAEQARADAEARARVASRVLARMRGVFEALEHVELELVEARVDGLSLAVAACNELGHPMPQGGPRAAVIEISRAADGPELPTVRPEAFDIAELMRSADGL